MALVTPAAFGSMSEVKIYVIELCDPFDGKVKQFKRETTWIEAQDLVNRAREDYGVEAIRLGVVIGDRDVRELFSTGSTEREED